MITEQEATAKEDFVRNELFNLCKKISSDIYDIDYKADKDGKEYIFFHAENNISDHYSCICVTGASLLEIAIITLRLIQSL